MVNNNVKKPKSLASQLEDLKEIVATVRRDHDELAGNVKHDITNQIVVLRNDLKGKATKELGEKLFKDTVVLKESVERLAVPKKMYQDIEDLKEGFSLLKKLAETKSDSPSPGPAAAEGIKKTQGFKVGDIVKAVFVEAGRRYKIEDIGKNDLGQTILVAVDLSNGKLSKLFANAYKVAELSDNDANAEKKALIDQFTTSCRAFLEVNFEKLKPLIEIWKESQVIK